MCKGSKTIFTRKTEQIQLHFSNNIQCILNRCSCKPHVHCFITGARCSSMVRVFAHGAMDRRIDPSWGGPIELFLVPASAPRLV